ncbi:hypothetical protein BZA77DRAFT_389985 [Pyronema omphalodes]|nr:hypothetical protein BZA77DRAFT_389985 [Pyronema omphalodes]
MMSIHHQNYEDLTTFLSNLQSPIDITILPDNYETILWEPPHLGIPKRILLAAFEMAHAVFFSDASDHDKFRASTILILTVSEHLTAINFRRRYLLNAAQNHFSDINATTELHLTTSFLTSQMAKHNKSPLIWNWRKWLLTTVAGGLKLDNGDSGTMGVEKTIVDGVVYHSIKPEEKKKGAMETEETMIRLKEELRIVRKSGSLHKGNYYAWAYGRDLLSAYHYLMESSIREEVLDRQFMYCRTHPSDCGGWGFLAFMALRCDDDYKEEIVKQLFRHAEILPSPSPSPSPLTSNTPSTENRRERSGEAFWLCVRDIIAGIKDRGRARELKELAWVSVMRGLVAENSGLRDYFIQENGGERRMLSREKLMRVAERRMMARREVTVGEKAVVWLERFWERNDREGRESRELVEGGEK